MTNRKRGGRIIEDFSRQFRSFCLFRLCSLDVISCLNVLCVNHGDDDGHRRRIKREEINEEITERVKDKRLQYQMVSNFLKTHYCL